jgi:hypothetical protein
MTGLLLAAAFALIIGGAILFTNAIEWSGKRLDLRTSPANRRWARRAAIGHLVCAGAAGDQVEGVGQGRGNRVASLDDAFGAAREVDDQSAVADAGDGS